MYVELKCSCIVNVESICMPKISIGVQIDSKLTVHL